MFFDEEAPRDKRRDESLDQLEERLVAPPKRKRYDPPITSEQLQMCLTMASSDQSHSDRSVMPYYYLKRTRATIGCTDWTNRSAIERSIDSASVPDLCCIACSLMLFPFDRPLSTPDQIRELRLRICRQVAQLVRYVHAMRPEAFYETRATVFDRPYNRVVFEQLASKFLFAKQLGRGTHAAAFEVTPDVPLESRAVRATRSALKISSKENSGAAVHAEVTRYLCQTPAEVFRNDGVAYGVVRLYYACRETEIDLRKHPSWCSPDLAKKMMGEARLKDFSLTIMELCEHDLARFALAVPRVALEEKFFAGVLAQVLCTLDQLAPIGFVHGDLHAGNVLLRKLSDYTGSELLRFERQRLYIPAHYSSGYVAKISDFDFARTGKSHRAAVDINLLACSLLAQIYGLALQRRVAIAEVPQRIVSTLRRLVAPSAAHQGAMAEHARVIELEATTEEASLKKYQSDQERTAMIRRVLDAALALMRAPFNLEHGTTADRALQLPLFDSFRELRSAGLMRPDIVVVNNGPLPVIPKTGTPARRE